MLTSEKIEIDPDRLREAIGDKIDGNEKKRRRNKRISAILVITLSSGSAASAVLIGLSEIYESYSEEISSIAMIISGLTAVIAAWDVHFKHNSLWKWNSKTLRRFYQLADYIDHARSTNTLSPECVRLAFDEYNDILSESNDSWDKIREG